MARSRRFRRTRRAGLGLLVIALLLVGGAGLGLPRLQRAATDRGDRDERRAGPVAPPAAGGEVGDATRRDRVFGALAAAEVAIQEGSVSAALRLLDTARRDTAAVGASETLQRLEAESDATLRAVLAAIVADVRAGHGLRAADALEPLVHDAHPTVSRELERAWAAAGWRVPRPGSQSPAIASPAPLPDRRRVLVRWPGAWQPGIVVEAAGSGPRVTVRVPTPAGLLHPTFERADVAPVDPTPAEILDQIRASHAAGRLGCTWAWCAVADARGIRLAPDILHAVGIDGAETSPLPKDGHK